MPATDGIHYLLHEGGGRSRPPVLLLHGAGGDCLAWPAEIRRMPGRQVISLDLPGHGKSEGAGLQSVEAYAAAVVKFLDALGIGRAVVLGHCMGGAVALRLAIASPHLVAGAALIACGPRLPIASAILENAANPSTLPLALKAWQEASFGPQAPVALRESAFRRLATVRQALLYGDLLACDRFDAGGGLEAVRAPVLVLCGKQDRLTPLGYSETLARRIPGAALQTVEGAGHQLLLEQPARAARITGMFLETLPAA